MREVGLAADGFDFSSFVLGYDHWLFFRGGLEGLGLGIGGSVGVRIDDRDQELKDMRLAGETTGVVASRYGGKLREFRVYSPGVGTPFCTVKVKTHQYSAGEFCFFQYEVDVDPSRSDRLVSGLEITYGAQEQGCLGIKATEPLWVDCRWQVFSLFGLRVE